MSKKRKSAAEHADFVDTSPAIFVGAAGAETQPQQRPRLAVLAPREGRVEPRRLPARAEEPLEPMDEINTTIVLPDPGSTPARHALVSLVFAAMSALAMIQIGVGLLDAAAQRESATRSALAVPAEPAQVAALAR